MGVSPETRCYVQDVRYFAIEHMDVRREAFQARATCQVAKVSGETPTPRELCSSKEKSQRDAAPTSLILYSPLAIFL